MEEIVIVLKIIAFFISTIGYWKIIKNKTGIDAHFAPFVTASLQICILFIAGLLNVLFETTIVLYIVGFCFSIYYVYKERKRFFKEFISIDYVVLLISSIYIMIAVVGKVFVSYDNFSHWALVEKVMLTKDRFPNFKESFVWFQQYPLGSSCFIYYFGKVTSSSEWVQMFAQGYFETACLFTLMRYCKRNKILISIFFLLVLSFLLVFNIKIIDLQVDTLLPIMAIGTTVFIYEEIYKKSNNKNTIWLLLPILSVLALIKNSGVFFLIIEIMFLFVIIIKNRKFKSLKYWIVLFSPACSYFLWDKHCKLVFKNAEVSKHAMTIKNYGNNYNAKKTEQIMDIANKVFRYFITYQRVYVLIGFIVFITCMICFFKRDSIKKHFKLIATIVVILFFYLVGTVGMYVFSMPLEEAKRLASISRYCNTVIIFIYGLLFVECIKIMSDCAYNKIGKYVISIVSILSICIISIISFGGIKTIIEKQENLEKRAVLEKIIDDKHLDSRKKYIICIPKGDNGYVYFLARYLLFTDDIKTLIVSNTKSLEKYKNEYYFINLDEQNVLLTEWIKKNAKQNIIY